MSDNFRSGQSPVLSVGAILLALGVVLFYMQWMTQSNSIKTTATIISFEETVETDSAGAETRHTRPFIWFLTQQGDTIRGTTVNGKGYQVGTQIDIVYKEDNPKEFYPAKSLIWYLLFGAITLLGGFVIYLSSQMKSEKWE